MGVVEVPKIFGRYQSIRVLGSGTGARVMLVNDLLANEVRALKVLLDEEANERFFKEFELLASIDHPQIVKVFDFGQDASGLCYFTMEYLPGGSLQSIIGERTTIPRAFDLATQILSALAALHARGILHADLKPANIFLAEGDDGQEYIKLLDFGLATVREDKGPGLQRGTLLYMAPELFTGGKVNERSDLYSAGVVIYELFTGRNPFEQGSSHGLVQAKTRSRVPSVHKMRPDCPPELARLVEMLLEPDPSIRIQSAEQALKMLEESSPFSATLPPQTVLFSGLPLVGRAAILEAFADALNQVTGSPAGKIILLSAEKGGGKTRLLQEARHRAQRKRVKLLEARGHDSRGKSPLSQLFTPLKLEKDKYAHLIERYQAPLDLLFPEDAERSSALALLPTAERVGLIDALGSLLSALAEEQPLVLLIDDVHLTEIGTRELLVQLVRVVHEAPILLCATIDSKVLRQEPFDSLAKNEDVEVLRIPTLSPRDIGTLLEKTFGGLDGPDKLSKQIARATGGNPSFVEELLESLVGTRALYHERGEWSVSTKGVAQLLDLPGDHERAEAMVRYRTEPLEPLERSVLNAAAVLGSELDEDVLTQLVAGVTWLRPALEALIENDILVRISDPVGHLRFSISRLQSALLMLMPKLEREALHRRAGELLLARSGPGPVTKDDLSDESLLEIAHHFLHGGDVVAGRWFGLHAAARAEQNNAFYLALQLYQKVVDLVVEHGRPPPPDVGEKIADLHHRLGHVAEAVQAYQELLLDAPPGTADGSPEDLQDASTRASLLVKLAEAYSVKGEHEPAVESIDQALPLFPEEDIANQIRSLSLKASYLLEMRARHQAVEVAQEGLKLIGSVPPPEFLPATLQLLYVVAQVRIGEQRHDAADEIINDGLSLAQAVPEALVAPQTRELRRAVAGLTRLKGESSLGRGDYALAIMQARDAARYYEVLGDLGWQARCFDIVGTASYRLGNWPEAIGYWERLRNTAERAGAQVEQCKACNDLGLLYKETGHFERAVKAFDDALELARGLGYRQGVSSATGGIAEVRARQEQFADARAFCDRALTVAREAHIYPELVENLRRSAELYLLEEKAEPALEALEEGLEIAREHGLWLEVGTMLSLKGAAAAQQQHIEVAVACFQEGSQLLEEMKADFRWAMLKYHQAKAYHRLGFLNEADSAFRVAEDTFRRLGASWALRRCHEALLRLDSENDKGRLRLQKLQLLLEVTQSLGTEPNLRSLLGRILDRAIELTQTDRGFIVLMDEQGQPSTYLTRGIARQELEKPDSAQFSSTVLKRVLDSRQSLAVTDVEQALDLRNQASILSLGLRSVMCAPMLRGEKILGVIYVDSATVTEGFYQTDVSVLEAVAHAAAISLENAQLVDALQRKNHMMSMLAHEFRTPIAASMTFLRLLLKGEDPLSEEQRDGLESVLEQSERLSRMISQVLELAGMEARQVGFKKEALRMDELIEATIERLSPLARESGVDMEHLEGVPDVWVYGNRDRLMQVVTNLLSNALKFTPRGGYVTVSTSVVEMTRSAGLSSGSGDEFWSPRGPKLSDTSYLVTRVVDSGSGIPEEDIGRIFDRFVQSGDVERRLQGTGLGLTIAKEIVGQHGGKIWADNQPSEGAMFAFALPLMVGGGAETGEGR